MNNTPHFFKKMGQVPPREAIEPILKNANQGVCSVRIEAGNFRIFQADDPVVLDAFMNALDQSNMRSSAIAFGFESKKPKSKDDMQPEIVLEDDEGSALIVAMWDGDVDVEKFTTIVEETWTSSEVDEDIEKMRTILDGPAKRSLILQQCCKEGGQIFIWPIVGEPLLFRNKSKYEEYGWGWVSNAFRQEAKPGPSVPIVGDKVLSTQERILQKQKEKQRLKDSTAAAPVVGAPPDTGTVVTKDAGEEMVTVGPPPANLTNKERRTWWTSRIGETPANYKHAVVTVPKSKLKGESPKSVVLPDAGKAVADAVTTDVNFMLMDPKIVEAIKEDFANMKTLDDVGWEKLLAEQPTFSEQTKIPLERWFSADKEEFRKLCVKYTAQSANLLIEALFELKRAREEVDALLETPKTPVVDLSKMSTQERIAHKAKLKAAGK